MTVQVITVAPTTSVKEIAQILLGAHIGGVPVVDDGALVGIVTSTDILAMVPNIDRMRTARDIMQHDPITLREEASVAAAARVLARNRIKRAPVVRDGKVVGMITRSDLLRPYLRTDSEIQADIEDAVLLHGLGISPRDVHVCVTEGVVELEGTLPDASLEPMLLKLVRAVDGVVDVSAGFTATLHSAIAR